MNRAVFLDRDGVLVEDVDVLTEPAQLRLLPGVPAALRRLHDYGFRLVVVTNQPVVARGLATEGDIAAVHDALTRLIQERGGTAPERFYFCPHHPRAELLQYQRACDCRKPRPGMLLQAARELGLDCAASYLVGDRITDILAGAQAGCRTILVETGKHLAPPITTSDPIDTRVEPGFRCADLASATQWILQNDR
jgi:D-glycero-D-manno-heptose 1,7-bisphosphate phosphatase